MAWYCRPSLVRLWPILSLAWCVRLVLLAIWPFAFTWAWWFYITFSDHAWGMNALGFSILHFDDFVFGWACFVCVQTFSKLGSCLDIVLWWTYLSLTFSSFAIPWYRLLTSLFVFNFCTSLEHRHSNFFILSALVGRRLDELCMFEMWTPWTPCFFLREMDGPCSFECRLLVFILLSVFCLWRDGWTLGLACLRWRFISP